MSRIKPYRTGYGNVAGSNPGYGCIGVPGCPLLPIDCDSNKYKKLPALLKGSVSDEDYENLSAIESDPNFIALRAACDINYDPFTGTFVDMYQMYVDQGLGAILADLCYESPDIYTPGYMYPSKRELPAIYTPPPHLSATITLSGGSRCPCRGIFQEKMTQFPSAMENIFLPPGNLLKITISILFLKHSAGDCK